MKKIERALRDAWIHNERLCISNSVVSPFDYSGFTSLRLFGNLIAIKHIETSRKFFSLAGWNSVTTRSRLKNVLNMSCSTERGDIFAGSLDTSGHYATYNDSYIEVIDAFGWYELIENSQPVRIGRDLADVLELFHNKGNKNDNI